MSSLRGVWKMTPAPRGLKAVVAPLIFDAQLAASRRLRQAPSKASLRSGPLIVSGFYNDVLGVGRGVAATADAMARAGLPVVRHDIRPVIASPPYTPVRLPAGSGGVWIQHCNAPETDLLFSHVGRRELAGRYRIAYWAWELPKAPPAWRAAARAFHEIWVPSRFVADAFAGAGPPVRIMPHPVRTAAPTRPDRARFGLPQGAVAFGVFADARSSLARKNPLGAVLAYRRAFPTADGTGFLSVKLVSPAADPAGVAEIHAAAAGRSDIRIWTERLDDLSMSTYLASLDAVVSLHRAEGFGLTVAEALLAGKPAISTAWSGNLDLFSDTTGDDETLVPARLVPVRDPSGLYKGGLWADPDLDAAADILRRVATSPLMPDRLSRRSEVLQAHLSEPWRSDVLARSPWFDLIEGSPTSSHHRRW